MKSTTVSREITVNIKERNYSQMTKKRTTPFLSSPPSPHARAGCTRQWSRQRVQRKQLERDRPRQTPSPAHAALAPAQVPPPTRPWVPVAAAQPRPTRRCIPPAVHPNAASATPPPMFVQLPLSSTCPCVEPRRPPIATCPGPPRFFRPHSCGFPAQHSHTPRHSLRQPRVRDFSECSTRSLSVSSLSVSLASHTR